MNASTRRRTFIAFGAVALACGASAFGSSEKVRGNGVMRAQQRSVGGFQAVELALPAQVEIRLGATESVALEGDENILPLVEVAVENGALQLRPVRDRLQLEPRSLRIVVNAKAIHSLTVGGSGSISAAVLKAPKLSFEIGGSGRIDIAQLRADEVSTEIGGSGNVKLGGVTRKLDIAIGGSGDVSAPRLKADAVEISVGGSGSAEVWALASLQAAIAGSGDIRFYGDPRTTTSVVGSGRLKRLGSAP